jgi:hypothetical protein
MRRDLESGQQQRGVAVEVLVVVGDQVEGEHAVVDVLLDGRSLQAQRSLPCKPLHVSNSARGDGLERRDHDPHRLELIECADQRPHRHQGGVRNTEVHAGTVRVGTGRRRQLVPRSGKLTHHDDRGVGVAIGKAADVLEAGCRLVARDQHRGFSCELVGVLDRRHQGGLAGELGDLVLVVIGGVVVGEVAGQEWVTRQQLQRLAAEQGQRINDPDLRHRFSRRSQVVQAGPEPRGAGSAG